MNKRQYKKKRKKVNKIILLDEFFLLDYDKEDYHAYIEDFNEYCYKHHRYKHYKDKRKGLIDRMYQPPIGKNRAKRFEKAVSMSLHIPVPRNVIPDIKSIKIQEEYFQLDLPKYYK